MKSHSYRRALGLCVMALITAAALGLSCSSLPTFVPDLARRTARPVPLEGARGPLSAAQSRAILQRLQNGGQPTDIFSRHLALEEAIVGSPLTTGNAVRLLQVRISEERDRCFRHRDRRFRERDRSFR